ncbi:MAG: hypothetical protein GX423_06585 [Nitrospiraceae bacterium]|jgi:hypothetical protein|nr:hypothetical protein [Nitrospiraceae bacterium]
MKRSERIGAAAGGIIGLGIAIGMDLLLGEGIGVGWRKAVAQDVDRLLKIPVTPDSMLAWTGAACAILILGAVGAAAGYVFVRIVRRFFRMLLSEE